MKLSRVLRSRLDLLRGDVPAAYEHLQKFQALANKHGDRATGTSGYEAAAQYVEQQLARAGYQSSRQYFTFEHRGEDLESFNIIAETARGSGDNVIMLGAHLDGVPNSPAINDNASGVAALLETAKELSQQDEINNKVRFAWWGAEEYPKSHGSRHYARNLARNDSAALANIAAYLNFDMVASPNYIIGVYDARESNPIHDVPGGSEEIMNLFTDYFDSRDQPWIPTDWDYDSDQVAFVKKGVAVGGLYSGDDDKKTKKQARLFGGTPKQPCDPNHHTSDDDISNMDPGGLSLIIDAIIYAVARLAKDNSALKQAGNSRTPQKKHRR